MSTAFFYMFQIGPGSQAEKSGLKKNDRIKSINSQSFEKISYKDATKLIRSNKKLKMTIVRKLPPSRSLAANSLIYEEPSFSDSQDKQTENSPRSSEMIWIDRKGERVLNYQDRLQNAERFKVCAILIGQILTCWLWISSVYWFWVADNTCRFWVLLAVLDVPWEKSTNKGMLWL